MTTTAPAKQASAPGGALTHKQIQVVMSGLMLGVLLAALDQTIVSTALPTIVGDLHRPDLYSWVVTSYLLTSTASTPLYGKISDLFGRKKVFQFAIVVFLLGSALCGLSQNMWELVAFRGVQGIGAGGLISLALAIVGDVIPPAQRGRYQGYFGAVFGASSVLGPLIGGFLTQSVSWRWVFYVNLPIGLIALVVTNRVLKLDYVKRQAKIDWTGAILLIVGVSLILVGVQDAGKDATISSGTLAYLLVGLAVVVAFVLFERRVEEPVLPMRLFGNPVFRVASLLSLITGIVMFGALVFLPQYFQIVKGSSPTTAGLRLLPLLAGLLFTSITSGRLISKTGKYKKYVVGGTFFLTVGMTWLSFVHPHTSGWTLAGMTFVIGFGLGSFMQTLVLAAQNSVEMKDLGVATSGVTFFRTMGGAIGASLLSALVLAHERTDAVNVLGSQGAQVLNKTEISLAMVKALPAQAGDAVKQLFTDSMDYAYRFAIPICVLAFLISFLLKEVALRTTGGVGKAPSGAQAANGAAGTPGQSGRVDAAILGEQGSAMDSVGESTAAAEPAVAGRPAPPRD